MKITNVSVPEVYKESADFRFFLSWVSYCFSKIKYDTENLPDVYDPLRCPSELLWMLADTVGFKYDDRLPPAFNRLVLLYFMSIIRNKGSKDGVTLAAELNLAQFNVLDYGKESEIRYDRLEDSSIPVNSVYVTPHTAEGYIDVVYFSDTLPIDACVEYARPVGMYLTQSAGVRYDARTHLSIDARLTDTKNLRMSVGPTHVGHYSREDYARMQKISGSDMQNDYTTRRINRHVDQPAKKTKRQVFQEGLDAQIDQSKLEHERDSVYYRNSDYEETPTANISSDYISPGYRALYSLQLCNNEHVVSSLLRKLELGEEDRGNIFGLGYGPQEITTYNDDYNLPDVEYDSDPNEHPYPRVWNLRYDYTKETNISPDVYTIDTERSQGVLRPRPAVNTIMQKLGDAMYVRSEGTASQDGEDNG